MGLLLHHGRIQAKTHLQHKRRRKAHKHKVRFHAIPHIYTKIGSANPFPIEGVERRGLTAELGEFIQNLREDLRRSGNTLICERVPTFQALPNPVAKPNGQHDQFCIRHQAKTKTKISRSVIDDKTQRHVWCVMNAQWPQVIPPF